MNRLKELKELRAKAKSLHQLMQATLTDGCEATEWVYIMNTLPPMVTVIESGSWKEYRH